MVEGRADGRRRRRRERRKKEKEAKSQYFLGFIGPKDYVSLLL